MQLREQEAKEFYKEHEGKTFYGKLVNFMTSGPIWTIVLAKKNAVSQWRELVGPTNSTLAREIAPERYLAFVYRLSKIETTTVFV